MWKLAIKVETHLKNKNPFYGSYSWPNIQPKSYAATKAETASKEDKSKDKDMGIVK